MCRVGGSLFEKKYIFDFFPSRFDQYYKKVILVKFGHDYSTPHVSQKGEQLQNLVVLPLFYEK